MSVPFHLPPHDVLKRISRMCRFDYLRFCRFLYIEGVQSARISRRAGRRCYRFFRPIGYLLRHIYFNTLGRRLERSSEEFRRAGRRFKKSLRWAKRAKKHGVGSAFRVFFHAMRWEITEHREFARAILNIAVPVCSVLVLALTIRYWNGMDFGLVLFNQGERLASIANEQTYEEATEMVKQRMVYDTAAGEAGVKFAPAFRLAAGKTDYQSADSVCNMLIRQSNGIIEEASGLYVDGRLTGAVKSAADLRYMLESRLTASKGKNQNATARYTANIETVGGLYPTASVMSTEAMRQFINGSRTEITTYTVKQGDTVSSLAAAKHTTADSLSRINPGLGSSLRAGDLLQLQLSVPNLEVELIQTVTYETEIPYTTATKKDDTKYTDFTQVVTQGVNGKQRCVDIVHSINGVETKRENISKTVLAKPVEKVILTGSKKRPVNEKGVASGTFLWPIPSLREITSYFEWRWGTFHKGIDISGANAYGSTIVAADGGVVELADWNDGYGECVIINHGNGKKTLYGHCSSLLVSAGEAVSKGQPIARVGSTGYSTGAHCHFEVIVGGVNKNPLDYVS